MNLRRTVPVPKGRIRSGLETVRAHLRAGDDLDRYVNTWQLQEGTDPDDIPVADWTLDMLPALRLDVEGGEAGWFNQVTTKTHVSYLFTLGVAGTDPGAGTDFFELLLARLQPGDLSLYSKLKPFGVMGITLTGTGFAPIKLASGRAQLLHVRLTLNQELRTQY